MITKDEILAILAGKELDALIAVKVMGLPVVELDDWQCPYCQGEMYHAKSRSRCTTCSRRLYSPYKEYSDEIESAWEVVEKIKKMWGIYYLPDNNVWQVSFIDVLPLMEIEAETAPLAICRAALLSTL